MSFSQEAISRAFGKRSRDKGHSRMSRNKGELGEEVSTKELKPLERFVPGNTYQQLPGEKAVMTTRTGKYGEKVVGFLVTPIDSRTETTVITRNGKVKKVIGGGRR